MSENTDANAGNPVSAPAANAPSDQPPVSQSGQKPVGQFQTPPQQPSQYQGNKQPPTQGANAGGHAGGHVGGHRQSYSAGGPGNKNHYNKRNNNYAGKGNPHHNGQGNPHAGNKQQHQHQQQQQQQYGGYGYPQNMYGGNYYYAYGYPQGMMPNMQGVPANYPSQSPQPGQQFSTSPSVSKVKITDKDGKQVDWEEKKSSTSTPKPAAAQLNAQAQPESSGSPAPSVTAPVQSSTPSSVGTSTPVASSPASGASAAAAAAARSAAAEEFRRKIMERAQAAKKKKDEEKAKLEEKEVKEVKEVKEAVKSGESAPVSAPVSAPSSSDSKPEVVTTEKSVPEPAAKEVEQDKKEAEKPAEIAKTSEVAEPVVESTEKPVEPTPSAHPVADETTSKPADEPTTKSADEPKEKPADELEESKPAETVPETSAEPVSTIESSVEPEETKETSPTHEDQNDEENSDSRTESQDEEAEEVSEHNDGEEDDHEHADQESVFDLSSYFDRLQEAKPIEDPFTFEYPYPLAGPDARWKSGAKKYRYDPQFLLQFGDAVQYPVDDAWKEKLEALGIVSGRKSSGGTSRMGSNRSGGQSQGARFNGSMPNRLGSQFNDRQNSRSGSRRRGGSANSSNPRDRSLRNRTQSKRGREPEEPPKPAEEVKPLVASANRWVPRSRAKKEEVKLAPDGSVLLEADEVERKVNSALNKLTLEMFEPISEDLLKIGKQSIWEEDAKTIKQVISLTFAKACDEPYWSSVYAQFCAKMLKEFPDEVKDVNTPTKTGEPAKGGDLARRILLATCQVEYEKGWVDKLPTNEDGSPLEPEMMSEEYYVMAAAKRRGLGLVKFIGNLYILNMLNDQVILHCLRDQSRNVEDPSEDSLENLAQLIRTVGPRFEVLERNKAALSMVYDQIQQILDKCKLSSRIRFMLMDLQDLRKSSWKAAKQEAGPKTIKEIHNAAELKKFEDQRASAEKRRQNKGGFNNSGFGGGDSRSNSSRSGSSWGNKKDSRAPTKDSRGFTSVSRNQSNRSGADSGPSSSNLAPRETSKRTDNPPSNMFAALGGGDHDD